MTIEERLQRIEKVLFPEMFFAKGDLVMLLEQVDTGLTFCPALLKGAQGVVEYVGRDYISVNFAPDSKLREKNAFVFNIESGLLEKK